MTPRCPRCGGELFTHDGERLCADCTSFRPADPDLEREQAAWREETGEDVVILSDGPADPY
jgi:uncharacterized Zn finger protein (UPF0148 family)